jgi:hypothetical protein
MRLEHGPDRSRVGICAPTLSMQPVREGLEDLPRFAIAEAAG